MELVGIWIAALLTLCIYSFLYRDNPFYRFAEHLFVGMSVGYGIVLSVHQGFIPFAWEPFLGSSEAILAWGAPRSRLEWIVETDPYWTGLTILQWGVSAPHLVDSIPDCCLDRVWRRSFNTECVES